MDLDKLERANTLAKGLLPKVNKLLDIHLTNGDVVTLKNECLRSFEMKRYMGAEIELDSGPGNIMVNIYTYDSVYHSISIPISSICWIDSHSEDIDWKEYKEKK